MTNLITRNKNTTAMEPYQPTDRNFYEELELLVSLKRPVHITFKASNGAVSTVNDSVYRLYTKEDAEYLELESGLEIRLDHLINVNGKRPSNFC
jgi:Rho-binding antiterminator